MRAEQMLGICQKYAKMLDDRGIKPIENKHSNGCIFHIRWMLDEIPKFLNIGRHEKANRWLGFIQGVMWTGRILSVDEMKSDNRKSSENNHGEPGVFNLNQSKFPVCIYPDKDCTVRHMNMCSYSHALHKTKCVHNRNRIEILKKNIKNLTNEDIRNDVFISIVSKYGGEILSTVKLSEIPLLIMNTEREVGIDFTLEKTKPI